MKQQKNLKKKKSRSIHTDFPVDLYIEQFKLANLSVVSPEIPPSRFPEPINISFSGFIENQQAQARYLNISMGEHQISGSGLIGQTSDFELKLRLPSITPWVNELDASMFAKLTIKRTKESPKHTFLNSSIQLHQTDATNNTTTVTHSNQLETTTASANLALTISHMSSLEELEVVQGKFQLSIPNTNFINDFLPDKVQMVNAFNGQVNFSGKLRDPNVSGNFSLDKVLVSTAGHNTSINRINAKIESIAPYKLNIEIHANDHRHGSAQANGAVTLIKEPFNLNLNIKSDHFSLIEQPYLTLHTVPNLHLTVTDKKIDLIGEIKIPKAHMRVKEKKKNAITVSEDQIIVTHHNLPLSNKQTPIAVTMDIRLIFGKDISFEGHGLETNLSGNLRLISKTNQALQATGELNLNKGRFRAYGQDLVIEKGRLLFAGSKVTQPGIDLRAVRVINKNIQVGVEATGPIKSPRTSIFSTPEMSSSEQLSYLVFGRPIESTGGGEKSALDKAALAIGLKGSQLLTEKVGKHIGVDEIKIDTAPGEKTEQASLSIGKYISPKAYVSYGIGLFEAKSSLKLEYTINPKWRFVTESTGDTSSGDIIYVIESGE